MGQLLQLPRDPRPAAAGDALEGPPRTTSHGEPLEARRDDELMILVRRGSRAAFRVLVARHADKLASFCARLTGDRAGAPEIAQEVWLALWDARSGWEPRASFASYLYTIAFTRCRNQVRARRRRSAVFAPEPAACELVAGSTPAEIDRLLARERAERLWEALGELPTPMREAVVLRFIDELSYEQMEGIAHASASTLRSRVHHALARLKRRLGKEGS